MKKELETGRVHNSTKRVDEEDMKLMKRLLERGEEAPAQLRNGACTTPNHSLVPDLLVCDEAHHLKNEESGCYKTVKAIGARLRLLLTGTPMQNNLGECKSLRATRHCATGHCATAHRVSDFNMIDLACPGRLGEWEEFKERYITPLEDAKEDETNELAQDISEKKLGELHKKLVEGPHPVVHYVGIEVLKEMVGGTAVAV